MRKYFGTDGIRGEANRELTVDLALRLGYGLGHYLRKKNPNAKQIRVILGSDTRISGYMLRSALTAGLTSLGVRVDFVGVLPTPAVAYITRNKKADAGIMISASHNPVKDNGIKLFGARGYKLPDEVEEEIEYFMDHHEEISTHSLSGDEVGKFKYAQDEYYLYRSALLSSVTGDFQEIKIIIDAANGSAYRIAKDVFLELGAEVIVINDTPNGKNINVKCGSTHPEILSKVVIGYEADLGLAYDGDADRLIAVDKNGNIVNGDKIIAILAISMKQRGELHQDAIVTTVMSNIGLENYLKTKGISLVRACVGDRYVLEKMLANGINLGGEQSGHIILTDYGTTGDGVLSSLKLVEAIRDSKKSLDEMVVEIQDCPQILLNIKVNNAKKNAWKEYPAITSFIDEMEKEMGEFGRVLVRTSGTEPLVRVMVEGTNQIQVEEIAKKIAEVVKNELA